MKKWKRGRWRGVVCAWEKQRKEEGWEEAKDLVFAMVLCVSDPETEEEAEDVWERERRSSEEFEKEREKTMKMFEEDREEVKEVWERERSLKEMIFCVGYG